MQNLISDAMAATSTTAPMSFTGVDYAIVIVILISVAISMMRGFTKEILSLVVWVLAVVLALNFSGDLANVLEKNIASPQGRMVTSFALIFLATLIVGGLFNFIITSFMVRSGLSMTDRILGVVLGAARGVVLVSAVVFAMSLTPMPKAPWWQQSSLMPKFEQLAKWMEGYLPENISNVFDFSGKMSDSN